ncbi:stimulator of interferon genes protein isoform X2 [Nelusetta ayraudi]|uniref:stimulator of interferon genes protein isoform X2 n=1 Tax=Nelusetta ayraudi TaxID=303726 RepID=UPI003F7005F7
MRLDGQMQSQQQQDALLPRPRGALPRVCATLLVAGATGGLRFLSPQELLGWVALVTLMLTLGPLLHGLCLLPEEVLHHRHTRYRGRGLLGHVAPACGLCSGTLRAAGLAALLLYLAGDPLAKHGDTWKLLVLTAVFYTLLKSLVVLVPSEVEVSDLCEARKTNVAHGLAWSFYLGYLKLVLPHLDGSIEWFRSSHLTNGACWSHRSRRLFILVPLDASISHKLEDEDDNIRFYGNLPNHEMDRAGVRGRVYKHSVYTVLDQNGKGHECVVEYATPLLTLYRMSQESSSGFGEAERRQQVLLFYRTLQDILELSLECRNRYTLILLNGQGPTDRHLNGSCSRTGHGSSEATVPSCGLARTSRTSQLIFN